jgi:hypothetical protein
MTDDEPEPVTLRLELRHVRTVVESRVADETPEMALVLTDGSNRVELIGRVSEHMEEAVLGAQRVATAALNYAAGLALLALPEDT